MQSSKFLAMAASVVLLATSFVAQADNNPGGPSFEEIRKQQLELREEVQAGKGVFKDMNSPERAELAGQQSRLLAMIEGKSDVSELPDAEQVVVFNLLQEINATINDAEGDRMVCEYTRKVGSHRKTKVCMTVSQREEMRDDSRRMLERANRGYCPSGNCTGG